jgi:thiamine pyrophosphate-dependent acetolactate synthase large subunit-like protein
MRQVRLLHDPVATELAYTHYEQVAQGFGAEGILVTANEQVVPALKRAKELFRAGKSVLINVQISRSAFREGSISL